MDGFRLLYTPAALALLWRSKIRRAKPLGIRAAPLYLFRPNRDPPATAAKIKPAAPSASVRITSMGIPIASWASGPSNSAVAAAAIKCSNLMRICRLFHNAFFAGGPVLNPFRQLLRERCPQLQHVVASTRPPGLALLLPFPTSVICE